MQPVNPHLEIKPYKLKHRPETNGHSIGAKRKTFTSQRDTFRAFHYRNFRLFWKGFAFSTVGIWMQTLALGWLVWRLTESPLWLGAVGATSQLPSLLLGSIGGALLDIWPKRTVLIITQTGQALSAFALAILFMANIITEWHILLYAAISGMFVAVDAPARLAFVGDIVAKEDRSNAIALNSSTFNGARLIGPAMAGILVPIFSEGICFLTNAVLCLTFIFTLSLMRNLPKRNQHKGESLFNQLRDAYLFVTHAPVQRVLIRNVMLLTVFGLSYTTLLPMVADTVLGKGAGGLGILMAASGVGALLGGIWQTSLDHASKRGWVVMMGMVGLGLGILIFSLSEQFVISVIALVMTGFSGVAMLTSTNVLLQYLTPEHMCGRVLGFYTSSFLGFAPIGALLLGWLTHSYGPRIALGITAAACLIIAGYTIFRYDRLRTV